METRIVDSGGHRAIEVIYYDVTPGNHESWTVPIGSLAVYGELLGYAEPVEALEAVIHILKHGLPEHCPVTGKNVFTDVFTLLAHREQAREDAAARAAEKPDATASSICTESSEAAYKAVHQKPAEGGDCPMDKCRREAREAIGVKDPSRVCGEETRVNEARITAPARRMRTASTADDERAVLSEALTPYTGEVTRAGREWLHELTGNRDDPLAEHLPEVTPEPEPEPEPEPGAVLLTADELLTKYQEGAA